MPAVVEMRDHRGRRQKASQPRAPAAQQVRVTVDDVDDDSDLRSQFSRSCVIDEPRYATSSSPRNSISGESMSQRRMSVLSTDDEDAWPRDDDQYTLIPMCQSFI